MYVTVCNNFQKWYALHLQMLFERHKELLTQSQVSQPKKDSSTVSTTVCSARATGNSTADSTKSVDQAQLSNPKSGADAEKAPADKPDTSNTSTAPSIAGSAAVRSVKITK